MGMEQIIVAFESPKSCDRVREIVENSGTASCIVCRSAAEVKRTVNKQRVSTVVCGFKLPDESAEDLFADLPSSCAMLMVAVQNLLDLCQTDDIFKLASPPPCGCCCRWGTDWKSSPGPSGAEKSRPSSRKPRGFSWSGTA